MRAILSCALLVACATPDASSTDQALRGHCPITEPDCGSPDDPGDGGGGGGGGGGHGGGTTCPGPFSGSVSASATSIPMGGSVALYWDVAMPSTCNSPGITLGGQPVAASGSMVVSLLASRSFPLQVGSQQVANVLVSTVLPSRVHITANTHEQAALFRQAVATPGETVLLKNDLELDVSMYWNDPIVVGDNVTIASEAPPPVNAGLVYSPIDETPYQIARDSRHLGPKVYTTLRPAEYLMILAGDNIKLRGFRFFGPDLGITDGMARGIVVSSKVGIELDRMEVAGWSFVGVYIKDPDHRNQLWTDVVIHDSFFHHNQHAPGGNGYGIQVLDGARALIQHNVFDFNRHAIMSGGEPETGYWANENLVLRGGGFHEGFAGVTWHTHIFDVHGTDNCGVGSLIDDSLLNCGGGGDLYLITKNAFQYQAGYDFKLRGLPSTGAYVTDNISPHEEEGDAYTDLVGGLHLQNNTQNVDTFGQYGACDFDGDGKDDLFLATGRTWWFSSGGAFHWTFLNSQTEQLSQLGLGDFNHDGRCDVLRVSPISGTWELSSAGTAQFAPLPAGFAGPMSQLRFADFNGDGYTDIFQRWPDGQWYGYLAPMTAGPVALQSSSLAIEDLRFGDVDGDGITDVLKASNGVWWWSRSGLGTWTTRNTRYGSFDGVVAIANIDGLPGDDLIRVSTTSASGGNLQVSSGGQGAWTTIAPVTWPVELTGSGALAIYAPKFFAGRFTTPLADTLLQLDTKDRLTTQFSAGQPWFTPHSLYAH